LRLLRTWPIVLTKAQGATILMKFPRKFVLALAIAGALLVTGCGDSDNSADNSSTAAGNPVDRAFVADMIPHHQDAVQMAQIAQRRGSSEFVKKLADDIVKTQNVEISTMRAADRRLKNAGVTKGSLGVAEHMMGMDDNPASLNTAKPFDRAFIKMMIPHHEGAVTMAKAEVAKGKHPELKRLAGDIVKAQQREITEMREHLGENGSTTMEHEDNSHGAARPNAPARASAGEVRTARELPLKAQDGRIARGRGAASPDMPRVTASR
jgi:uncharacterized protein (DUF305 family)